MLSSTIHKKISDYPSSNNIEYMMVMVWHTSNTMLLTKITSKNSSTRLKKCSYTSSVTTINSTTHPIKTVLYWFFMVASNIQISTRDYVLFDYQVLISYVTLSTRIRIVILFRCLNFRNPKELLNATNCYSVVHKIMKSILN